MSIGDDANTTAGSILYVSTNLPATDTLAGFQAVTSYTKIGDISDMGELPIAYTPVPHEDIEERVTKTLKGGKEPQSTTIQVSRVVSDAGQVILSTYADDSTYRDTELTVRIVHKDGTVFYGTALVMSFNTAFGGMNSVTGRTIVFTFNSTTWEDVTTHWTVTYASGAHGQVIGATTQVVADGEDGEYVIALPDSGYQFTEWTEDSGTDEERYEAAVSQDLTFTATFEAIP
jgi:uncharacterized repeat protein (TIGR02543 family)